MINDKMDETIRLKEYIEMEQTKVRAARKDLYTSKAMFDSKLLESSQIADEIAQKVKDASLKSMELSQKLRFLQKKLADKSALIEKKEGQLQEMKDHKLFLDELSEDAGLKHKLGK